MTLYKRITKDERVKIYTLKNNGLNNAAIAEELGRNKSTIGHELKRCANDNYGYHPEIAQQNADKLKSRSSNKFDNPELKNRVINDLKNGHSPEQIAGRIKHEKLDFAISDESIYKFIYDEGKTEKLYQYLRYRRPKRNLKYGRKRQKKSNIPNLVPIAERPKIIEKRKEIGHWEADLVIFSALKSANVTTLVERKSRLVKLIYNPGKYTSDVIGRIYNVISLLPKNSVRSMTFDQGTEFSWHNKLGILTYFCRPGSPWEKGSNENFNGRLRRFLPKNFDHRKLSQKLLDIIAERMNNTPRKCLNYKTPNEVFNAEIAKESKAVALGI